MKKQLISYFVIICMAVSLAAVVPAAAAGAGETTLADIHYDSASGKMVSPVDVDLPGEVDTAAGGQKISPGNSFNCYTASGGMDTVGKELTLTVKITPNDTASNRYFQAFSPAGGNRNLLWFKAGGEAGVVADDVNNAKGNTFTYKAGHTYLCRVTLNLITQAASALVTDETDGVTSYQSNKLIVPDIYSFLPRIKVSFEKEGSVEAASSTVLHEMKLTQQKPAATEELQPVADIYYDSDAKTMKPDNFDYSGCPNAAVDAAAGGLKIKGGADNDTDAKTLDFNLPDSQAADGKTVIVDFCMTMTNYGTRRSLIATHDGGKKTTLFESNPSRQAVFFGTAKTEKPGDGVRYNLRFVLDPLNNKAKASMMNLASQNMLFTPEEYAFDFDRLENLEMVFAPKKGDGEKVSIFHGLSVYKLEKTEIALSSYAIGMPPYTEGDTAELRLEKRGTSPLRATAYYDTICLGTRTPPEAFAWRTPALEAGTHRIFAVAEYEDGTVLEQKGEIQVGRYAEATSYLDSDCSDTESLKGIENVSSGGLSGGSSKVVFQPIPGNGAQDNALLLQPDAAGLSQTDYDANNALIDQYNMNYNISAKTNDSFFDGAQLLVWESDLMFLENQLHPAKDAFGMGCLEVRFKDSGDVQRDKILVSAKQDGNLSFIGSGLSVPYEANTLYHLKVQLNKDGYYNIVVSDSQGPLFSGYHLKWYDGGANSLVRFKYQQNAVVAQKSAGTYLDNIRIYSQQEDGVYLDTVDVRKGGAPLYDLSSVKAGQEFECRASIKNHTAAEVPAPVIVFAVVDAQGQLIEVKHVQAPSKIPPGGTTELLSVKMTAAADLPQGTHVKAYVWSDLQQIQPVTNVRTY